MKMPSVMSHSFSEVPKVDIQRSSFNRSHGYKTTFNSGYLVPFFIDEALPGDTFNLDATVFARLATPIAPIMDNMFLDTFFFAVPVRLLWQNWKKFNGEQRNPGDSTDYLIPQMVAPAGGYDCHSIHDYFGIPTKVAGLSHSSLWHRAYNLIWNEWFRDENLQPSVTVDTGDGPDLPANYTLLKRGKRHDYFTSCLPFPQKGAAVNLPLGTEAPILGKNMPFNSAEGGNNYVQIRDSSNNLHRIGANTGYAYGNADASGIGELVADLSKATAATINQLRQSFQIQRLFERDARGGTRYPELIKSHFGVSSSDYRMQRPEYLGGNSQPLNVTPIAQTSSTDATTPQGNLAAMGTVTGSGNRFVKSFEEHCVIIGLVCARADLNYQQGLNRMFSRKTRFDFYWPALAQLGEQSVLNKEIYAQGTVEDDQVFGYQERYAEYRYKPSQITGQLRSNHATTLDSWHLAQNFSAKPVLNAEFIQENPPLSRCIAVPSAPHFLFDSYIRLITARPMPIYSVPGMIDHF